MKKFLLFITGLIAVLILLANLGPMILLGVSVWLLYVIFKKFIKSESTVGKIGWVVLGLLVLSISLSNIYAVIGLVAIYGLYLIIKNWKSNGSSSKKIERTSDDPFQNFEREWAELNH